MRIANSEVRNFEHMSYNIETKLIRCKERKIDYTLLHDAIKNMSFEFGHVHLFLSPYSQREMDTYLACSGRRLRKHTLIICAVSSRAFL